MAFGGGAASAVHSRNAEAYRPSARQPGIQGATRAGLTSGLRLVQNKIRMVTATVSGVSPIRGGGQLLTVILPFNVCRQLGAVRRPTSRVSITVAGSKEAQPFRVGQEVSVRLGLHELPDSGALPVYVRARLIPSA